MQLPGGINIYVRLSFGEGSSDSVFETVHLLSKWPIYFSNDQVCLFAMVDRRQ